MVNREVVVGLEGLSETHQAQMQSASSPLICT